MNWEIWGPPLGVLGVGAVVAVLVALKARGGAASTGGGRAELEARKASLMEEIHLLDVDQDKLSEDDFARRRASLVDQAAQVLAQLDALGEGSAATPNRTTTPGRKLAWGVGVVAFFAVAGVMMVQLSEPKSGPPPGMTQSAQAQAPQASTDPEIAALQAQLAQKPGDIGLLNELTYRSLLIQDLGTGMTYLEQARQINPEDPDVLVHLGMLQAAVGMYDRALPELKTAAEARPDVGKGWLWLGYAELQLGDGPASRAALSQAMGLSLTEPEKQLATAFLADAVALGDAVPSEIPSGTITGDPGAGHPGMGAADATASVASTSGVAGSIRLADGVSAPASGAIYVLARASADGKGAPLAALRLPASPLSTSFEITSANAMMGGAWPAQVYLEARVDLDGSAETRDDQPLSSGVQGPFEVGQVDATLVLQAR